MLFTFPEDAGWKAERHAPCGVEIGEYCGVVRVHRRVFQRSSRSGPRKRVDAYYLQRTRFESIAKRKIRRRQLT